LLGKTYEMLDIANHIYVQSKSLTAQAVSDAKDQQLVQCRHPKPNIMLSPAAQARWGRGLRVDAFFSRKASQRVILPLSCGRWPGCVGRFWGCSGWIPSHQAIRWQVTNDTAWSPEIIHSAKNKVWIDRIRHQRRKAAPVYHRLPWVQGRATWKPALTGPLSPGRAKDIPRAYQNRAVL